MSDEWIKGKNRAKNKDNGSKDYLHAFIGRTHGLINIILVYYWCAEPEKKARLIDVTQQEAFGCR